MVCKLKRGQGGRINKWVKSEQVNKGMTGSTAKWWVFWVNFCLKTCPFKAILSVTCAKKHTLGDGRGGSKLGCLAPNSDPCIVRICQLNRRHRRALTQMLTWEPYPPTMEKWVHKGKQGPWYWGPHSLPGNDSLSEASHQLLLSVRTK